MVKKYKYTCKTGRPQKFKTVEELEEKIDEYFASCFKEDGERIRPFTITGLALALDTTRETLLDYEKSDKFAKFSDTIKKAKQTCQNYAEEHLFTSRNVIGAIFSMKNNYGWKDKTEVDTNFKGNITFTQALDMAEESAGIIPSDDKKLLE